MLALAGLVTRLTRQVATGSILASWTSLGMRKRGAHATKRVRAWSRAATLSGLVGRTRSGEEPWRTDLFRWLQARQLHSLFLVKWLISRVRDFREKPRDRSPAWAFFMYTYSSKHCEHCR